MMSRSLLPVILPCPNLPFVKDSFLFYCQYYFFNLLLRLECNLRSFDKNTEHLDLLCELYFPSIVEIVDDCTFFWSSFYKVSITGRKNLKCCSRSYLFEQTSGCWMGVRGNVNFSNYWKPCVIVFYLVYFLIPCLMFQIIRQIGLNQGQWVWCNFTRATDLKKMWTHCKTIGKKL